MADKCSYFCSVLKCLFLKEKSVEMRELEVHYSKWKHMVRQWSVCARQKKGTAWMGSNCYQKIATVVGNAVLPSHSLAQQH